MDNDQYFQPSHQDAVRAAREAGFDDYCDEPKPESPRWLLIEAVVHGIIVTGLGLFFAYLGYVWVMKP